MPAINNYGFRPSPDFAFRRNERPNSTLTFGVELEVDFGADATYDQRLAVTDVAQAVTDAAEGRIYCKHDSSLRGGGFEIVTHPASLAYHTYQFRWANVMRLCSKAGLKSHDTETCGLHIHVGRAGLGDSPEARNETAAKLVLLAHVLREPLTKFSRRKAERLDNWAKFPDLPSPARLANATNASLVEMALETEDDGRYQAVNLTNSATVEFRIFRGTLKRDTLVAALQLVSNLCQYAMTHTPRECLNATYVDIVNVAPHKELVAYSQSKRLITTTIVAA